MKSSAAILVEAILTTPSTDKTGRRRLFAALRSALPAAATEDMAAIPVDSDDWIDAIEALRERLNDRPRR